MNELRFFRCPLCGKLVWEVMESGVTPVCCGKPMEAVNANSFEGIGEKHVPVSVLTGSRLKIRVGEVLHPSAEAHHIEWIAVKTAEGMLFRFLAPGEPPELELDLEGFSPLRVFAYCNLHGLWKGYVKVQH